MSEVTAVSLLSGMRPEAARERISTFSEQFGLAHIKEVVRRLRRRPVVLHETVHRLALDEDVGAFLAQHVLDEQLASVCMRRALDHGRLERNIADAFARDDASRPFEMRKQ